MVGLLNALGRAMRKEGQGRACTRTVAFWRLGEAAMIERIELRGEGGPLLGILVGGTALQIKRGARMFEVDLFGTLAQGRADDP